MNRVLPTSLLGAALSCAVLGGAQAQVIYGAAPTYAYAGPAIRGDYVGAPFTRFPRPDRLVPSAWGYGTYGVPTVSGIAPAPIGTPTVYVIDSPSALARTKPLRARAQASSRSRPQASFRPDSWAEAPPVAGGARIISVTVPPRRASLRAIASR